MHIATNVIQLALLFCVTACAQEPLLDYLVHADDSTWAAGGNLSRISRGDFRFVSDADARAGFSCGGSYSDLYRSGPLEAGDASFARGAGGAAFLRGKSKWPWLVSIESGVRTQRLGWNSSDIQQNVFAGTELWSGALVAATQFRSLETAALVRTNSDNRLEPGIALRWNFRTRLMSELAWRKSLLSIQSDFAWHDQFAAVETRNSTEILSGRTSIRIFRGLRAEAGGSRNQLIARVSEEQAAELQPWGRAWSYHGFLACGIGRAEFSGGLRGFTGEFQAYGRKADTPFAKFTALQTELRAPFVALNLKSSGDASYLFELERAELNGYARGHVEFWPFTSGFIDLLGLRRYFIADLSANWWRAHWATTQALAPRWAITTGVNLIDARVDATVNHWAPEYLIFGKTDEQFHRLNIYHLLAGMLSGGVSYTAQPWQVSYSFAQVVPLRTWKRETAGVTPGEPAAPSSSRPRAYGGAVHRILFSWTYR